MRGLRRRQDQPGLPETRRTLINRYMADADGQMEPELDTRPPEQGEEPGHELAAAGAVAISDAPPQEVEPIHSAAPVPVEAPTPADPAPPEPAPAEPVLRLLPPAPDRQVTRDVSRRTLEEVARLCRQLDSFQVECARRRERLVAAGPRPSSPPVPMQPE